MEKLIARTAYDREGFEQLVEELEGLFVSGKQVDHWGEQVLDQQQLEQLGLKGLRKMLGKGNLQRADTLGVARIAQIIGLASIAARGILANRSEEENLAEQSSDFSGGI